MKERDDESVASNESSERRPSSNPVDLYSPRVAQSKVSASSVANPIVSGVPVGGDEEVEDPSSSTEVSASDMFKANIISDEDLFERFLGGSDDVDDDDAGHVDTADDMATPDVDVIEDSESHVEAVPSTDEEDFLDPVEDQADAWDASSGHEFDGAAQTLTTDDENVDYVANDEGTHAVPWVGESDSEDAENREVASDLQHSGGTVPWASDSEHADSAHSDSDPGMESQIASPEAATPWTTNSDTESERADEVASTAPWNAEGSASDREDIDILDHVGDLKESDTERGDDEGIDETAPWTAASDSEDEGHQFSFGKKADAIDALLDGENSSSDDDSDSDSSNAEDDDGQPYNPQVVVKEAPLLRLENVTSITRSSIPVDSLQRKNQNKSWGGWLGFGKKKNEASSTIKRTQSDDSLKAEKDAATEDSSKAEEIAKTEGSSTDQPEDDESLRGVSRNPSGVSTVSAASEELADSSPRQTFTFSKKKNAPATGDVDDSPWLSKVDDDSKPIDIVEEGFEGYSGPDGVPALPQTFADPPSPESKSKTEKKKRKKSKKDKKGGLTSHLQKNSRKLSRHGDEISVGTMDVKKNTAEQQHVMLSTRATSFDENDDPEEKSRPWEANRKSSKKNRRGRTFVPSLEDSIVPIAEEVEESEQNEDPVDLNEFHDAPQEERSKEDQEKLNDELAWLAGPSLVEQSLHQGRSHRSRSVSESHHDEDDDDLRSFGDDDHEEESEYDSEAQDQLGELATMTALQSKLLGDEQENEVDFDDMWDDVSADMSTALEYERRHRVKSRTKSKKAIEKEKRDEAKAKEVRRLRLFEKQQKDEKTKRKKSQLSNEFLSAIHKVFDDSSAVLGEDFSERSEDIVEMDKDTIEAIESGSMVEETGGRSKASKSRKSGKSSSKSSRQDDDSPSAVSSHRSRSTSHASSRRTTSSRRSTGLASIKSRVNPAEAFDEEMKRIQGSKVLSVSGLRQEMRERRGTTVNLLKKEFAIDRMRRAAVAQEQAKLGASTAAEPSPLGNTGESSESEQEDMFERVTPRGLSGHLSRWGNTDDDNDLDDLRTVQYDQSPRKSGLAGLAHETMDAVSGLLSSPIKATTKSSVDVFGMPTADASDEMIAFSDMQLGTIEEFEDENGLLSGNTWGDESESKEESPKRRNTIGGSAPKFNLKLPKAPKMGKLKSFVPKVPKLPGGRRQSANGFSLNDDYGSSLLG